MLTVDEVGRRRREREIDYILFLNSEDISTKAET